MAEVVTSLETLMDYNPQRDVDPKKWEAMDEGERVNSVIRYHRRKRIHLPSEDAHAAIHTIVENQIALGDAFPAKTALARLMNEGLDRHEAVHALGSIAADQMQRALRTKTPVNPVEYALEVERLTAASWRARFASETQRNG
jgi:hypothetical protein